MVQIDGCFCIHVSDQRQTGLEKNTSSWNYGARDARAVFVFHSFENFKASFS